MLLRSSSAVWAARVGKGTPTHSDAVGPHSYRLVNQNNNSITSITVLITSIFGP